MRLPSWLKRLLLRLPGWHLVSIEIVPGTWREASMTWEELRAGMREKER